MTNDWVRDLLGVWHKPAIAKAGEDGGWLVRCLSSWISVDKVGLPGAGAQFCSDCLNAIERDERAG